MGEIGAAGKRIGADRGVALQLHAAQRGVARKRVFGDLYDGVPLERRRDRNVFHISVPARYGEPAVLTLVAVQEGVFHPVLRKGDFLLLETVEVQVGKRENDGEEEEREQEDRRRKTEFARLDGALFPAQFPLCRRGVERRPARIRRKPDAHAALLGRIGIPPVLCGEHGHLEIFAFFVHFDPAARDKGGVGRRVEREIRTARFQFPAVRVVLRQLQAEPAQPFVALVDKAKEQQLFAALPQNDVLPDVDQPGGLGETVSPLCQNFLTLHHVFPFAFLTFLFFPVLTRTVIAMKTALSTISSRQTPQAM